MNADKDIGFDPTTLRVLIVDDSAPMRQIIGSILNSHGVGDIEMAADGLDALRLVRDEVFDFIICDLMMRRMDGYEFIRKLRNTMPAPIRETPTIVLSSNADLNSILQARDAGMNEYLVKPISSRTLWQRVKVVMKGAGERREPASRATGAAVRDQGGEAPQSVQSERATDRGSGDDVEGEVFSADLMARYRLILTKEVREIANLAEEMGASRGPSRDEWMVLVRKSHDLKGHSGSFGYYLISELSHVICEMSRGVLDNMARFKSQERLTQTLICEMTDAIKDFTSRDVQDDPREHPRIQSLRGRVEALGIEV